LLSSVWEAGGEADTGQVGLIATHRLIRGGKGQERRKSYKGGDAART